MHGEEPASKAPQQNEYERRLEERVQEMQR